MVVSHKALIEAELEAQKQIIMSKLEKGQILEGTVKNITSYGVFIDLGGVDGLIHITDLSWGRVNHPEEIVQLDQKLKVVILDFDEAKKRIALGLKQLTPHPWEALDPDLKVGDKVKGKVVVMADYGAFVEIAPGVEGLIHVSEMSWSQHLRSAQEFMKVGDEVEAVILTLDRAERKMSLGIKQLTTDPWADIEQKYPVGTRCVAKVRNFTNFGVFVEIEEGIDGLVHISDLSWTKKVKHPGEFTQIGADLEVVVLEIDKENRRLSLGHKQLEENPWNEFEGQFSIDSIHEGTVTELVDKGRDRFADRFDRRLLPDETSRQGGRHDGQGRREAALQGARILEGHQAHHAVAQPYVRRCEACRVCCREGREEGCRRCKQVGGEEDQRFGREDHAGRHRRAGRAESADGCQGGRGEIALFLPDLGERSRRISRGAFLFYPQAGDADLYGRLTYPVSRTAVGEGLPGGSAPASGSARAGAHCSPPHGAAANFRHRGAVSPGGRGRAQRQRSNVRNAVRLQCPIGYG